MFPMIQPRPRSTPAAAQDQEALSAALAELSTLAAEGRQLLDSAPDLTRFPGLYAAVDTAEVGMGRLTRAEEPRTGQQAAEALVAVRRLHDQLRGQIAQSRTPIAEARATHSARLTRRQELVAIVEASLEPALAAAVAHTRAALQEAEQHAGAARTRMQAHEQAPPATSADTPAWARELGTLRDELAGYQLLLDRARAAAQEAQQRHAAARLAAWDAQEAEARAFAQQVETDGEAAIAAARLALQQAEQALVDGRRAAMERLSEVQQARA